MRKALVYYNGTEAGILAEVNRQSYLFTYAPSYLANAAMSSISLTLPKSTAEHRSGYLFPFFSNMLSEGVNRKLQCLQWRIDETDSFGLLMATAQWDTIGPVTLKPVTTAP